MTDAETKEAIALQNEEASRSDFRSPNRLSDSMYNFYKGQLIHGAKEMNTAVRELRKAGSTIKFDLADDGAQVNVHIKRSLK